MVPEDLIIGRVVIVTIFVLAAGAVAGCSITDVGKPLSAEITANPESASVGDTVAFTVAGTGRFLSVLTIDYGDAADAEVRASGQQSAGTFRHAYGAAGTYDVVGAVFDSSGQMNDTIEVVIQPAN